MAGIFGGGGQSWTPLPTIAAAPSTPIPNEGTADQARRAAELAAARQVGRSATILEDYASAIQPPPARMATLGSS